MAQRTAQSPRLPSRSARIYLSLSCGGCCCNPVQK